MFAKGLRVGREKAMNEPENQNSYEKGHKMGVMQADPKAMSKWGVPGGDGLQMAGDDDVSCEDEKSCPPGHPSRALTRTSALTIALTPTFEPKSCQNS